MSLNRQKAADQCSDPTSWPARPVILLTGGTSGVGKGIAERLLDQLSSPQATDLVTAFPQADNDAAVSSEFSTPSGLTLVIAARNIVKFHQTRAQLLKRFGKIKGGDGSSANRQRHRTRVLRAAHSKTLPDDSLPLSEQRLTILEYKTAWIENLRIEFVALDLASVESTLDCCTGIQRKYPYLTHIFLNAGGGPFSGLDWLVLLSELARNFVHAVTYPSYMIERKSVYSKDNLGWTWQCNVFGHFLMAKTLLPLMRKSHFDAGRLIWTSSLEGLPRYFDAKDYMAVDSGHSYQSAKFQIALLALAFNDTIQACGKSADSQVKIRSFVAHPSIAAGAMFTEIIGRFLDYAMILVFYVVRLFGSPYHVVSTYKSALCFTFLALASDRDIKVKLRRDIKEDGDWQPVRFSSRATRLGQEYVTAEIISESDDPAMRWFDEKESKACLAYCEQVQAKVEAEKKSCAQ